MQQVKKIFLVGYMGCGKSTLGRKLSRRLRWRLVDTDHAIEEREGASVADIFRYEGEEHFREEERRLIEELAADAEPMVISTGGGLPTWSDNMAFMNGVGLTLYIRRSAEQIASRLSPYGRQKRPRLRGLNDEELVAFMRQHMAERAPHYEEAHLLLDGDRYDDEELVAQVLNYIDTMKRSAPIGVYDSGLGGLSVWRELWRLLPDERYIYLGDGKNCPYGERSKEEVARLADEAVGHLVKLGCKLVVVACNTATAAAIEALRTKYSEIPIVGMEPAVKPACLTTRTRVVGVLATERSLDGALFRRTAARYGEDIEVLAVAGHGFVELVEEHREESPEAEQLVRKVVEPMLERGADRIVLGCTHYPFLIPLLRRIIGEREVELIDPSPAVARRVRSLLDEGGLLAEAKAEQKSSMPHLRIETFADESYRKRIEAMVEQIVNQENR